MYSRTRLFERAGVAWTRRIPGFIRAQLMFRARLMYVLIADFELGSCFF